MTVIATMLTHSGTAHATDSLLTVRQPNGEVVVLEEEAPKLLGVRQFRGVIAYWGYAGTVGGMRTLDWLRREASSALSASDPEAFARHLAEALQAWLQSLSIASDPRYGIGIHFSAYEQVDQYWIPELFLISNFLTQGYAALRPEGVGYSRETFSTITGIPRSREDREPERRRVVQAFLAANRWLRFNNGDPTLFNPTADSIALMLETARHRGVLAEIDLARLGRWARLPVETVSHLQRDFYRPGVRVVGGRVHDLAVTPQGEYSSSSGDAP